MHINICEKPYQLANQNMKNHLALFNWALISMPMVHFSPCNNSQFIDKVYTLSIQRKSGLFVPKANRGVGPYATRDVRKVTQLGFT